MIAVAFHSSLQKERYSASCFSPAIIHKVGLIRCHPRPLGEKFGSAS